MADEISVTVQFSATKGNLKVAPIQESFNPDMTGSVYAAGASSIPTTSTGTALAMGSVTTAGVSVFKNADATNYIEVGTQVAGAFVPFVKLLPGEVYPMRLGTSAPYARANTAAAVLQYVILQD